MKFDEIQLFKKNICYFYHEQAAERFNNLQAKYLNSDFNYESIFDKSFLLVPNMVAEIEKSESWQDIVDDDYFDLTFIVEGVLIIIFCMALEKIEEMGNTITPIYDILEQVLRDAERTSVSSGLIQMVKKAIQFAAKPITQEELVELDNFRELIYQNYILSYYERFSSKSASKE